MSHRRPIPINPFTMYTLWYAREKGYERSSSVSETEDGARTVFAAGFNEILVSTIPRILPYGKIVTLIIYLMHLDVSI